MIESLKNKDIEEFTNFACEYKDDFCKLYDVNNYINDLYHNILVFKVDDKIVAFIIIENTIDEVLIMELYVAKEYRNKGIAKKLIEYIILNNDNKNRIILEVKDNNVNALNLYNKFEFKKIGIRNHYYNDHDAIVMERKCVSVDKVKILSIESSCDETSIAIVENGKNVLSLSTNTQIDTHAKYGGVVPELASRMHTENILFVLKDALEQAKMNVNDVDAIAVTYGPGLMGSLLVGVEFAKTLALLYNKPLIKVNHMIGHIYANNIESTINYPALCMVVSGGHTELLIMEEDYKFKLLGATLDDAIGESYDKVAKVLGVPYPGGPNIEKMAKEGSDTYNLPYPACHDDYNFSYSGLKSAVLNLVNNETMKNHVIRKNDLACSFQNRAIDQICRKVNKALQEYEVKDLIVAGGVSSNNYLREELKKVCSKYKVNLKVPSLKYCTDNAAMIGAAAYPLYLRKEFATYDLNAKSSLDIVN